MDSILRIISIEGDSSVVLKSRRFHAGISDDQSYVELEIELTVQAVRGKAMISFSYLLDKASLANWLASLKRMKTALEGTASLNILPDEFGFEGCIDHMGHIIWKGRLALGYNSSFDFRFAFSSDQSFLPDLIQQSESFIGIFSGNEANPLLT